MSLYYENSQWVVSSGLQLVTIYFFLLLLQDDYAHPYCLILLSSHLQGFDFRLWWLRVMLMRHCGLCKCQSSHFTQMSVRRVDWTLFQISTL